MSTESRNTDCADAVFDTMPEQEQVLLRRLAAGDAEAFWDLWEQYRSTEFTSHCLRWMGGSREDAEDALSGASLRALERLLTHASAVTNAKAWLTRLLYNHCMNVHKVRRSHLRHVQPGPDAVWVVKRSPASGRTATIQDSAEDEVLRRELRGYLHSTIHTLPPRLREPVMLYYVHGMPHRDIAARLRLSPENVRKRLQQARQALREKMAPYLSGETEMD
jgi:RNA polymerase sigma factor (sigma-70 family)